jgi:endonuclease YncB( thermonuclease family)
VTVRSATAHIIEVIDGDTFHANLDIGWGIMLRPRSLPDPGLGTVRAVFPDGTPYDAPEVGTVQGRLARVHARKLIKAGEKLEIVSFKIDAFGRTLASVDLTNGGDWATEMTVAGFIK